MDTTTKTDPYSGSSTNLLGEILYKTRRIDIKAELLLLDSKDHSSTSTSIIVSFLVHISISTTRNRRNNYNNIDHRLEQVSSLLNMPYSERS